MNEVNFRRNGEMVTARECSPDLWSDIPMAEFLQKPNFGWHYYEDFSQAPVLVTPTITTQALYGNGLKAFGSSGGTIITAGIEGGGGLIATETDDNEGASFATIALPFKLARGKGKFWFEARLKTNEVANTKHGFFLGLLEAATLSATVPIAAAGTLTDNNFVGFHRLEGDGDQIDTVYKADGVTQVTVKADAISATANVHTVAGSLAADTYIKLGMKFDPIVNRLFFFINNVLLPDSKLIPSAAGTDFPNDVQMGLVFAMLCASADDAIVTFDWWRAAQVYSA